VDALFCLLSGCECYIAVYFYRGATLPQCHLGDKSRIGVRPIKPSNNQITNPPILSLKTKSLGAKGESLHRKVTEVTSPSHQVT
jgi:hypothetical protein